ncbi:MAG: outer membrane lipoprotein chaperone LolA [Elusimicrobia bacterium]|nr:outer membrane lipoprotein chaperone LolA [Elusimicrobiota bacterium]
MKNLVWIFVIGLCGVARAGSLEDVVARLERAEKEVQSLQFNFTQKTTVALGGGSVESRGTAMFQRPNRFRVEQSAPENQTLVSNGKTFWVHLPDRGQVLKDSMDHWSRFAGFPRGLTPFRMDVAEMKKKYQFSLGEEEGRSVLTLTPKDAGDFPYTLRLWVDMDTGIAEKTALVSENMTAVVTVQNIRVNPRFESGTFRFVPPEGTDVLELPFK